MPALFTVHSHMQGKTTTVPSLFFPQSTSMIYFTFYHLCFTSFNKSSPYGNDGRLFANDVCAKIKVTWHKNREKIFKIRPDQI